MRPSRFYVMITGCANEHIVTIDICFTCFQKIKTGGKTTCRYCWNPVLEWAVLSKETWVTSWET